MTTIVTFKANSTQCELLCKKETVLAYRKGTFGINQVVASDTYIKMRQKAMLFLKKIL